MAEPKNFTVVFPDYRLQAYYSSNTTNHLVDHYICDDGTVEGNTLMKLEFANACTTLGYEPRSDYWAIQYVDGQGQIEYANGHPNTEFSGNTNISEFINLLEKWAVIKEDEVNLKNYLDSIPTWDEIRRTRDGKLSRSDAIISWSTETGNTVPSSWTTYRQELRDITTTYGANTGNTQLVVWPTEPAWPTT